MFPERSKASLMLLCLPNRCFYVYQIDASVICKSLFGPGGFELFGGVAWGWSEFSGFGGGFSKSR